MKQMVCILLALFNVLSLVGCASTGGRGSATSAATAAATTEAPKTGFVEVMREGESQQISVVFVDGGVGSYTIAMDPEYFTHSHQETADIFAYEAWPGTHPVYYAISAYTGAYDAETFLADSVAQFESLYTAYTTSDTTLAGYPATVICFDGLREAPEYCRHIYLVDCGDARFLIEAEFTLEMYEGLYAIMRALFNTLYI